MDQPQPITQIVYLTIPTDRDLNDASSYYGRLWHSVLDLVERSDGFQRLYWGRGLEKRENVQLHIIRQTQSQHTAFRQSPAQKELAAIFNLLSATGSANPIQAVRHVAMRDFTPASQALGKGAPFTGSAVYLRPTPAWHEGAWPLWTHIVRYVDGCMGCSGGRILEDVQLLGEPALVGEVKVEGKVEKWEGYVVYVGWESVEKHDAYHHTKHFSEHRVILRCGNAGYAEYGHVVFEGSRERSVTARM